MTKKALITGITGQDGAYLTRFLLSKGYEVHGIKRRCSSDNTRRLFSFLGQEEDQIPNLHTHFGDMTDATSLTNLLQTIRPDEIYNLAAQSHVRISFDIPEYTGDVNALGTIRLLEAVRNLDLTETTRFYQASTSELFGKVRETPQKETTPFIPRSPYGIAKLYAYWAVVNYREAYHLFACNGILFNHESPLRGENFVTRKITMSGARIKAGLQETLKVGNLEAKRDWGHSADYVRGMWLMLQQEKPDDYILATGEVHSVRDFIEIVFKKLGYSLYWKGSGIDEKGFDKETGKILVEIDPEYFRPTDVEFLCGDSSKAREKLGWTPDYSFENLVEDMLQNDLAFFNADK